MRNITIELGKGLEDLVPAMQKVEEIREEIGDYSDIESITVNYNDLCIWDLSSVIYGVLLEIQTKCEKKGIVFVKNDVER